VLFTHVEIERSGAIENRGSCNPNYSTYIKVECIELVFSEDKIY